MDSLNQGGLPSFSGIMAASREREIDIGGVETLNDLADNPALKFVSPTKLNQSCATLTELGNRRRIRQELQAHIDGLTKKDANTKLTALHRSEEHTSELQSIMRIQYAAFCLKK